MEIKCDNCNNIFLLDQEQVNFVLESKVKGMTFLMIKCALCQSTFKYNPQIQNSENSSIENLTWHSPISGSHGFVSYIDDSPPFFGCGETGAIWYKKENFFRDIELIISKYKHRKEFYRKVGANWLPSNIDIKRSNILIDKEEKIDVKNYIQD